MLYIITPSNTINKHHRGNTNYPTSAVHQALGRTHGALYRGFVYVPLRFGGGGGGGGGERR